MAGYIGIKIANGEFFPIIEENTSGKKRLVLTTVHDRQDSVQIDFFRSFLKSMEDAQYIGSLVVEKIKSRPKGDPSIEVIISIDENGNIAAEAYDLEKGAASEHNSLNISLKSLDSKINIDDFPDFDIEERTPPQPKTNTEKDDEKKFPWFIMIFATLFVIITIGVIWYFFLGGKEIISSDTPVIDVEYYEYTDDFTEEYIEETEYLPPPHLFEQYEEPVIPEPTIPEPVISEPIIPEPVEIAVPDEDIEIPVIQARTVPVEQTVDTPRKVRPPAPVLSYRVPAVIPPNGVRYLLRWGDTYWEISQAFYRDPWLYKRIYERNKARFPNENHIVSGFYIVIPPLD